MQFKRLITVVITKTCIIGNVYTSLYCEGSGCRNQSSFELTKVVIITCELIEELTLKSKIPCALALGN